MFSTFFEKIKDDVEQRRVTEPEIEEEPTKIPVVQEINEQPENELSEEQKPDEFIERDDSWNIGANAKNCILNQTNFHLPKNIILTERQKERCYYFPNFHRKTSNFFNSCEKMLFLGKWKNSTMLNKDFSECATTAECRNFQWIPATETDNDCKWHIYEKKSARTCMENKCKSINDRKHI